MNDKEHSIRVIGAQRLLTNRNLTKEFQIIRIQNDFLFGICPIAALANADT
jgi:hypothetical protein